MESHYEPQPNSTCQVQNADLGSENAIQPYTPENGPGIADGSILNPSYQNQAQCSHGAGNASAEGVDPLAARLCRLPSCRKEFRPVRAQDKNSRYCCQAHRAQFWSEVHKAVSDAFDAGHDSITIALTPQKIRRQHGDTDVSRVLALLEAFNGEWIDHPYARLQVRWNDRIRELRNRGLKIDGRRVGSDYQYRLVK